MDTQRVKTEVTTTRGVEKDRTGTMEIPTREVVTTQKEIDTKSKNNPGCDDQHSERKCIDAPVSDGLILIHNINSIEMTKDMKGLSRDWNIYTNQWLRESVFDKVCVYYKHLNKTVSRQTYVLLASLMTFMVSAIWHGLRLGYLYMFIGFFIGIMVVKESVQTIRDSWNRRSRELEERKREVSHCKIEDTQLSRESGNTHAVESLREPGIDHADKNVGEETSNEVNNLRINKSGNHHADKNEASQLPNQVNHFRRRESQSPNQVNSPQLTVKSQSPNTVNDLRIERGLKCANKDNSLRPDINREENTTGVKSNAVSDPLWLTAFSTIQTNLIVNYLIIPFSLAGSAPRVRNRLGQKGCTDTGEVLTCEWEITHTIWGNMGWWLHWWFLFWVCIKIIRNRKKQVKT